MSTGNKWVGLLLADERYEVQSLLGKGGMGSTFLAHDRRMDKPAVIKIPAPELLVDEEFAVRFDREICSLVKLEHPKSSTLTTSADMTERRTS